MGSWYSDLLFSSAALVLASYFAFLETAFTSLRLYKVKELEEEIGRYGHFFQVWKNAPQKILTAILVAGNFFNILCSVLITRIVEDHLGEWGIAVGVALATVIVLLFGDIIPKTFAKVQQGALFRSSLGLLNFLLRVLEPVVKLLLFAASRVLKVLGVNLPKSNEGDVSEAEIEFLIGYGGEKGVVEAEKSEMLQNIFGLGVTSVREIMVPKNDAIICDIDSGLEHAKDMLLKHRYSRLPLYKEKEDNVVGMVYHKDLFSPETVEKNKKLEDLLRPVMFVPETKKINQLLQEFLKKHLHMAVVVDEHGAIAGLATLEDVLEEIVGEIRDEHEREMPGVVPLKKGGWLINAGMPLEDVSELLDIAFDVENSVTLAGFMMEELQRLPKVGEKLVYRGYEFLVHEASGKRVFLVKVTKTEL